MQPQRILIIKLGGFGDIVMSEGAMRCIRAQYPQAHITLITHAPYRHVMEKCPHFDAVEPDDRPPRWQLRKWFDLKNRLRQGRYDLVFDLQGKDRTCLYMKWTKASHRVGRRQRHATIVYDPPKDWSITSQEDQARQVATAGVDISAGFAPDWCWAAEPVDNILAQHGVKDGFVFLIPGCSTSGSRDKRWPYYAELTKALAARGITCVTAPGPDELDLCAGLPATMVMDGNKVLDLGQIAGLHRHAAYVVGNDTGPLHFLAACKTRGLAIFGGHVPAYNTGITEIYDVIEKPNIADISPAEVEAHVARALDL